MTVLINLLTLLFGGWLRAFVLVKLYAYFLFPLGLPLIGIAQMYGANMFLLLLVNPPNWTFFRHTEVLKDGMGKEQVAAEGLVYSLAVSLMIWGVGAIVYHFLL